MSSNAKTRKLVTLAMLCALAYTTMAVLRIPVLFLTVDFKDVIILTGGFLLGPLYALIIATVVPVLEMFTVSDTELFGCAGNILSSVSFTVTASFIYHKNKTLGGAVIGLIIGVLFMTGVMTLWNYLAVPAYRGWPREAVVPMLATVFVPFNVFKGTLNATAAMLLFKPIATVLHKSGLIEPPIIGTRSTKIKWIFAAVMLITAIALLLFVLKPDWLPWIEVAVE